MPDKLLTFYFYGPASSRLISGDLNGGDYIDLSYNAIYGTYYPPDVPKLTKAQLGPAAVHVNTTPAGTAVSLATRTIEDGYGVYLYYSLPGIDVNSYLSRISSALYDTETEIADEDCIQPWISAGPTGPMREQFAASRTRTGRRYGPVSK